MSGAWDDMLQYEQSERENAAGISSVAGLAALRAGARRAGLEYGQSGPANDRSYPTPPCATCGEPVYLTVSGPWRHVERDYAHDAAPVRENGGRND